MDLRLSADPYESFRIFQGRILEQYLAMSTEFNFLMIDANHSVESQQTVVRDLVSKKINLGRFQRENAALPTRLPEGLEHRFRREIPSQEVAEDEVRR